MNPQLELQLELLLSDPGRLYDYLFDSSEFVIEDDKQVRKEREGLIKRVHAALHDAYGPTGPRLPQFGSVMKLGSRHGHEMYYDVERLRDDLRAWVGTFGSQRSDRTWLEQHPPTQPVDKEEVVTLLGKTASAARRHLLRAEEGIQDETVIGGIIELLFACTSFTGGNCNHESGAEFCTSCGWVAVA